MNKFKTLKDHVYDYIAEQILIGKLHPEDKISENLICKELSVSRTPVREALIQLSSEGILDNVPRRGFVVKNLSRREASELYVVLGNLDGLSARLACPYLTEKMYRDMEFYLNSIDLAINSKNYEIYVQQQRLFHQIYIDQCHNDALIEEIGKLKNKFLNRDYEDDPEGKIFNVLKETNKEHRHILALLREKRGEEAADYIAQVHWAPTKSEFELMTTEE